MPKRLLTYSLLSETYSLLSETSSFKTTTANPLPTKPPYEERTPVPSYSLQMCNNSLYIDRQVGNSTRLLGLYWHRLLGLYWQSRCFWYFLFIRVLARPAAPHPRCCCSCCCSPWSPTGAPQVVCIWGTDLFGTGEPLHIHYTNTANKRKINK